jgi:indole-3-glycerol phosphate synthase
MLEEIIKNKEEELKRIKSAPGGVDPATGLKDRIGTLGPTRDFNAAVGTLGGPGAIRVIAEVKKASPSKGIIREDFDPLAIAEAYEKNGAAAVSVLTDEKYFSGSLEYLTAIKNAVKLPVLRKDFIIDEFQVYESRAAGADAVLLIAAALDKGRLAHLLRVSKSIGLHVLVEVHNEAELKDAIEASAKIIGINNRDLKTFRTDIATTVKLAPMVPKDRVLVTESGINTAEDINRLKEAGAKAFLIGECLMREPDPGKKLKELLKAC